MNKRPIKATGNVLMNFYIPVDLKAKLWFVSGYYQQSLSKTIVKALEEYIKLPGMEEIIAKKIIFQVTPVVPKWAKEMFPARVGPEAPKVDELPQWIKDLESAPPIFTTEIDKHIKKEI